MPANPPLVLEQKGRADSNYGQMRRRGGLFVGACILTVLLSGCGLGSEAQSAKAATVKQNLESAISQVTDVAEVTARYQVITGMGSTASVRITAAAGTESLETVMHDSLLAFAGASAGMKTSTNVSFQVTEEGQQNTISPDAVGLQQKPSAQNIIDFANNAE